MAEKPARSPWTNRGLSLIAGLALALAQPPFGFLPGLLGWAGLLALLSGDLSLRSAFFRGWLGGVGYFAVSLWWLTEPFQVDAAHQGWMAPIAVALVTAGMGLFWGAAALAFRLIRARGALRVLVFAGVFALVEWLRGHILTGFPWDLPGETWRAGTPMSQGAALVGAYGLSWITIAAAAAPATLLETWRGPVSVALAAGSLAGLFAFGATRLANAPGPAPGAPIIRVVQADVPQASKYDPALFNSILTRYLVLTRRPAARTPAIVVWPEGAIPDAMEDYLAPQTWTREAITDALSPGEILILGGYTYGDARAEPPVVFNSLLALQRGNDGLKPLGLYDKFRLVPFGEFIPLDALATRLGIKTFVHVGNGFTPGPRPRPLRIDGAPPFQPLICYEALYPGFTREGGKAAGFRPAWIANISNDAWFGETSGPLQHLNIASYRAIEEGLPMIRATPTGVSAVIDALGRPLKTLPEGGYGVIDTPLPPALMPTPFARLGDAPFWGMIALSFVSGLASVLIRR
ncbi:MAG TPA: apolipoprotein N-acyltransferase [Caulobacteraceae bacterium]